MFTPPGYTLSDRHSQPLGEATPAVCLTGQLRGCDSGCQAGAQRVPQGVPCTPASPVSLMVQGCHHHLRWGLSCRALGWCYHGLVASDMPDRLWVFFCLLKMQKDDKSPELVSISRLSHIPSQDILFLYSACSVLTYGRMQNPFTHACAEGTFMVHGCVFETWLQSTLLPLAEQAHRRSCVSGGPC